MNEKITDNKPLDLLPQHSSPHYPSTRPKGNGVYLSRPFLCTCFPILKMYYCIRGYLYKNNVRT